MHISTLVVIVEFPWAVAILDEAELHMKKNASVLFGGSLIAPNVVLTIAHRLDPKKKHSYYVRLGEWDLDSTGEQFSHKDVAIKDIIIHKDYDIENVHNDIALLILEESVAMAPNINTICLPEPHENFDYQSECFVAGWGKLKYENKKFERVLKRIKLGTLTHNACEKRLRETSLGQYFELFEGFICAGGMVFVGFKLNGWTYRGKSCLL